MTWVLLVVLLLAVIGGIYVFSQGSAAEAAKDNAIADAASEVGNAASQVGEAAGQVGDAVENVAGGSE